MSANINRPTDNQGEPEKLTEEQIALLSFEVALQKIEQIARSLESGRIPLSDSLVQYENGMLLLQHCRKELGLVQQRFEALKGINSDGSVEVETLHPEEFKTDTTSAGRGANRVVPSHPAKSRQAPLGGDNLLDE